MTRRALFSLILGQPRDTVDELAWQVIEFDKPYGRFARELFGCGETPLPVDLENCRPAYQRLNKREFEKARKAAAKLFGLKECLVK